MVVEDYIIEDWDEAETGVLLEENEDWVLIKSIPVDFQVDGYKLINKACIENRFTNTNKALKKVLELRKLVFQKPKGFEFKTDSVAMLKWVESTYGCFEFQDATEDELFYGVLNHSKGSFFTIDSILSDGTIDLEFDAEFSKDEVRVISFDSDYFNAISLLYNHKKGEEI